jgi:pyruvate carboxylase
VRVDSALYAGYRVPPYYDSLIAKLIVYGRTRQSCMMRMRRALEEMVVDGIKTNIPLHQALLRDPAVIDGDYSIKWLELLRKALSLGRGLGEGFRRLLTGDCLSAAPQRSVRPARLAERRRGPVRPQPAQALPHRPARRG